MSDRYDLPIPVQPDWQGHYPCSSQHGGSDSWFTRPFGDGRPLLDEFPRSLSTATGNSAIKRNLNLRDGLRRSADGNARRTSPVEEQLTCPDKTSGFGIADPCPVSDCSSRSSGPNDLRMVLSADTEGIQDQRRSRLDDINKDTAVGDDAEVEGDDDDVVEGESALRPQTTEERLAARRKMKRFRLTHQQTRFLMSEFAKQPHPDASHRELLSREIPGLSPRQVQVWFQNRRAKIKRLTADDRERMVRMRAVPEGFDNVQALHSPYGAVHGLGMASAAESPFGNHMLRPLMMDVRRQDEAYMSSSGLTPSFGAVELGPAGGMGSSDMLSSMPNDRFAPLHAPSRTGLGHTTSLESLTSKLGPRQPIQGRDPMPRMAPDALQSPLRGSLPWKSDSFDYSHYPEAGPGTERHRPVYNAGQAPDGAVGGFEAPSYQGSYSSLQPSSEGRPRLRTSSASLHLDVDFRFRDAYRSPGGGPSTYPQESSSAKPEGSMMYSALQTPGPLSAPSSSSPRRALSSRIEGPETSSNDFGRGLQAGSMGQRSNTPMKDYFGNTPI
ncbi:homeobox domain-containing protein [Ophiocordyceps camponoti-floridani]|uniref:Homeobox domain-containing protein n=1 Tax=Ophiocordyceps camponoti-floridani TaxID=2030778 RepID=A0A8H4VGF8_9HYPO|nr:homeobox domain-containing protein [Ophiocordyceps camponoti-floridani]